MLKEGIKCTSRRVQNLVSFLRDTSACLCEFFENWDVEIGFNKASTVKEKLSYNLSRDNCKSHDLFVCWELAEKFNHGFAELIGTEMSEFARLLMSIPIIFEQFTLLLVFSFGHLGDILYQKLGDWWEAAYFQVNKKNSDVEENQHELEKEADKTVFTIKESTRVSDFEGMDRLDIISIKVLIESLIPLTVWIYLSRCLLSPKFLHPCHWFFHFLKSHHNEQFNIRQDGEIEEVSQEIESSSSFLKKNTDKPIKRSFSETPQNCGHSHKFLGLKAMFNFFLNSFEAENPPLENFMGIQTFLTKFMRDQKHDQISSLTFPNLQRVFTPLHVIPQVSQQLQKSCSYLYKLSFNQLDTKISTRDIKEIRKTGSSKKDSLKADFCFDKSIDNLFDQGDNDIEIVRGVKNDFFACDFLQPEKYQSLLKNDMSLSKNLSTLIDNCMKVFRLSVGSGNMHSFVSGSKDGKDWAHMNTTQSHSYEVFLKDSNLDNVHIPYGSFIHLLSLHLSQFLSALFSSSFIAVKPLDIVFEDIYSEVKTLLDQRLVEPDNNDDLEFQSSFGVIVDGTHQAKNSIYDILNVEVDSLKTGKIRFAFDEATMMLFAEVIGTFLSAMFPSKLPFFSSMAKKSPQDTMLHDLKVLTKTELVCDQVDEELDARARKIGGKDQMGLISSNLEGYIYDCISMNNFSGTIVLGKKRCEIDMLPRSYWSFTALKNICNI